jgi:hypothetical protein
MPRRDVTQVTKPGKPASTTGIRRWAYLLDDMIPVPGTGMRFGLDALIGLVPGVGDMTGAALSAYTLLVAARVGAPPSVIMRVAANILIDMIVGAVPLLGDLFDAGFKANRRNVALLDRYLANPSEMHRQSRMLVAGLFAVLVAAVVAAGFISFYLLRWLLSLFS